MIDLADKAESGEFVLYSVQGSFMDALQAGDKMAQQCPVCKLMDTRHIIDYAGWKVNLCRNCEFSFATGGKPVELQSHYDDDYFLPMIERDNSVKWQNIYRQKLALAQDHNPGRNLLEIGPGAGGFSVAAVAAGFSVFVLDGSQAAIDRLAKLGVEGEVADLNSVTLPAKCYDVVSSSHVIEHLNAPLEMLEAVFESLKPGGLLLLSFPAYENWLLGIRNFFYHVGLANHPYNYQAPDHVSYFSKRCIVRVLRSCGYEVQAVKRTKFISVNDVIERLDGTSQLRRIVCRVAKPPRFFLSRVGYHRDLDIVATKPVNGS